MVKMLAFVQVANILTLSDDVVLQTIDLRKTLRIKTPDAIIAATALVHGLTLLTHDGGFNKVPGLVVVDPHGL
ncbi:MAG: PIN domain-containing protein [Chitinophagaceae bacterium]